MQSLRGVSGVFKEKEEEEEEEGEIRMRIQTRGAAPSLLRKKTWERGHPARGGCPNFERGIRFDPIDPRNEFLIKAGEMEGNAHDAILSRGYRHRVSLKNVTRNVGHNVK